MIRTFRDTDTDALARIWLETNRRAHSFVPAAYWQSQLETVRRALPQAELYVWEEAGEPVGFLGLEGEHIAGIFVRYGAQSRGIGRRLLDRAKAAHSRLTLCVYRKNTQAAAFYRREGFALLREQTDAATGETEYLMEWAKSKKEGAPC